jgi:hypothetical protein
MLQYCEERSNPMQYNKTVDALASYAKKKLSFAHDLEPLFARPMSTPKVTQPQMPDRGLADETDRMKYLKEAKEFAKATSALKTNLITLYIVVWGQCSEAMQSKIKNIKGCTPKKEKHNSIWLSVENTDR